MSGECKFNFLTNMVVPSLFQRMKSRSIITPKLQSMLSLLQPDYLTINSSQEEISGILLISISGRLWEEVSSTVVISTPRMIRFSKFFSEGTTSITTIVCRSWISWKMNSNIMSQTDLLSITKLICLLQEFIFTILSTINEMPRFTSSVLPAGSSIWDLIELRQCSLFKCDAICSVRGLAPSQWN